MKFLDLEKFLNSEEEDNKTAKKKFKNKTARKKPNRSPELSQNTKKKREYSGHNDVVNILHLLEDDEDKNDFNN